MSNISYLDASKGGEGKPLAFNDESPLYFDVWERPAYFKGKDGFYDDPHHKHIVRMWKNEPVSIGLVGRNYKLIKNKELYEGVEDTIMDALSVEELDGVTRQDNTSYLGSQSIRSYVFPNIKVDIGSARSDISFRIITVNRYDGSSSLHLYSGAIDFFCSNGMVTGLYDLMTRRHTSGLTIPKLTDKLRTSIDIFYKQADQWKHWVGKVICDEDAEECFKAMPNVSERRVDQLMHQFRIECDTHGRTVWALYSAATFYASRDDGVFGIRESGSDHKAATMINREKQVRSWLSTDEFEKIAA